MTPTLVTAVLFSLLTIPAFASDSFRINISGPALSVDGQAGQTYVIQSAARLDAAEIDEIVFDGDSLISGGAWIPSDMTYWRQLMRLLPTNWTAINWSVSGQTGAAMLTNFWTRTGKSFNPGKKQAVLFTMGANDLHNEKASAEVVVARHVAYLSNCVAAGYSTSRIFIRPISPRRNPGFPEATRQAVNATLAAMFPENFLPVEAEPRIYAENAQMAHPELFADLTHPNATGAGLEANAFCAFISDRAWIERTNLTVNSVWEIPAGTRFYKGRTL